MQGIAFELLQKSKKTCDKIRAGGENTGKTSYGVDRQRNDEQRNGTVRSRKAKDGRSNAPQCNGIALNGSEWQWNSREKHRAARERRRKAMTGDATEKQCKAETSNGKEKKSDATQRKGIDRRRAATEELGLAGT